MLVAGLLTGVALVATSAVVPQQGASAATKKVTQSLTVKTAYGAVKGKTIGGAQAFLGIPFAKPPVYNLMFKAPVAPAKWSGRRDATKQQPACTQFQASGVKNGQATSLDCLYLDVYRPAKAAKSSKLPVMVWYHGGGSTQGTGVIYGGQTLADRTNTIVVSTNYRLGASGGLDLAVLDAENPKLGSGNYALEDQIQALKWVEKDISKFGGDKNNVTIFGQSAGGGAVCNMLASPYAKGLFDKAIIESSSCSQTGKTVATQQAASANFAAAAGCPVISGIDVALCLRDAWPATLVAAQQKVAITGGVVGTGMLPVASGAAIAAGTWNKVPILTGGVRHEARLLDLAQINITPAGYTQYVSDKFGAAAAPLVLAKYPLSAYPTTYDALTSLDTDNGIACAVNANATLLRGKTPVYRYEFNDPTSPTLFGFQYPGVDMSSAHSGELAYLFDFTLGDKPLTHTQRILAHEMQDYWAAFARNGTPYVKGAASWPRFTSTSKAIVLGPKISVTSSLADEHNCAFFASLPPKA